jgi:hypothetical protein
MGVTVRGESLMIDEQSQIEKRELGPRPEENIGKGRSYSSPVLVSCGGILELTQGKANGTQDGFFSGTLESFVPPPPPPPPK